MQYNETSWQTNIEISEMMDVFMWDLNHTESKVIC